MSEKERKEKAAIRPPLLPRRPGTPEEGRWPSPVPLPAVPVEDVGRLLRQILARLDGIEGRLDRIEKILQGRPPTP